MHATPTLSPPPSFLPSFLLGYGGFLENNKKVLLGWVTIEKPKFQFPAALLEANYNIRWTSFPPLPVFALSFASYHPPLLRLSSIMGSVGLLHLSSRFQLSHPSLFPSSPSFYLPLLFFSLETSTLDLFPHIESIPRLFVFPQVSTPHVPSHATPRINY